MWIQGGCLCDQLFFSTLLYLFCALHWLVFFLSFSTAEEEVENFDVSSLPEEVLQNIEADSYWCMSKLLDGIQVNWFLLFLNSEDNWLMSWLWTTLRMLQKSSCKKIEEKINFPIMEICHEFGEGGFKKCCTTFFVLNFYMSQYIMMCENEIGGCDSRDILSTWCQLVEIVSSILLHLLFEVCT